MASRAAEVHDSVATAAPLIQAAQEAERRARADAMALEEGLRQSRISQQAAAWPDIN
ncbi:hypothetical protein OC861_005192, partial [Tilletia horrida]